jgi:hypothetical protein
VIPVSLLTEHDGLIHFEEHLLAYRFNASSSNASNAISILNSANDAC